MLNSRLLCLSTVVFGVSSLCILAGDRTAAAPDGRRRGLQTWWSPAASPAFVPISSKGITWTVLSTTTPAPPSTTTSTTTVAPSSTTPLPVTTLSPTTTAVTPVEDSEAVKEPPLSPPSTPNVSKGYLTQSGTWRKQEGSSRSSTSSLPYVTEDVAPVKSVPRPLRGGPSDGVVTGAGEADGYWSEEDEYRGQEKGEWCNWRWNCAAPNVCKSLLWNGRGECRPADEVCPPPGSDPRYSYDCSIIGEPVVYEEPPPTSTSSVPAPLRDCYKWSQRYTGAIIISTQWEKGPYQCQTICQSLNACRGINYDSENKKCDTLSSFGSMTSDKASHLAAPRTCGWVSQTSAFGLDFAIENWITQKLAKMTPEEKAGQMVIAPVFNIDSAQDLEEYSLGAVLWPPGMFIEESQSALAAKWDAYYDASMRKQWSDGDAIPPLISVDAVHGNGNAKGATLFPHNIGLGCANDTALLKRIGEITAKESAATGTDWILAPTVAVSRDQRWGRTYESYSEDAGTVDQLANSIVRGMQGDPNNRNAFLGHNKQMATCKHWVGDGGASKGMTDGDTEASEEEIRDVHALPYYACIRDNAVQSIMPSFTSVNKLEMHGHKFLLTDVLKNTLGFDGILVGDYNGHSRSGDDPNGDNLTGCSVDYCPFAIHAGIDMLMIGGDWRSFIRKTSAALRSGEIDSSRVDDAVRRILRVKSRLNLIGPNKSNLKGRPSSRREVTESKIGNVQHIALAREAVHKSVVLLKNRQQILPMKGQHRFFVTGRLEKGVPLPHFKPAHVGAWSLSWQNTDTTNANFPSVSSMWEAASSEATRSGGWSVLDTSSGNNMHGGYTAAIVVIGETPYAETKGDLMGTSLSLQTRFPQDLKLLQRLREKAPQVPRVCVLLSGRPLYINQHLNLCDAFIAAWLPGTAGGVGIVDLLTGRKDFTGKLSMNWPATPCQTNIRDAIGQQTTPFFPYGYGLNSRDISRVNDLPVEWRDTC